MTKQIAFSGIFGALYIVLSLALAPFSFGEIQFRIGEILLLLPFVNKRYSLALIVGCFIVNLSSPLGIIDVVFGTLSTALMCFFISKANNIWLVPIIAAFLTGTMIGFELYLVYKLPLLLSMLTVGAGELVVVVIGVIIFSFIKKSYPTIYNKLEEI